MISWFKKHFIPHSGNNHRPHFLHKENIRNIILVVLFLEIFTFLIPTLTHIERTGGMAAVLPAILSSLTNEERQSQNLSTLSVNPILVKAAEQKAEDMATKGYFAHTSPEGKTPWYWLEKVGYRYQYAGENLAINFTDSKDVTNAWMASPTHRANIVKDKYTEVGTGIAVGIFEGKETVFVAQIYANPLKEPQVTKTETAKTNIQIPTTNETEKEIDVLGAEASIPNPDAKNISLEEIKDTVDISTNEVQRITFWQKLFASPRNTTNIILFFVFGIVAISLLLYIFIKLKNHHPDLITNGLIVVAIIGAIFVVNYYLSYHNMITTEGIDYSSEVN